MGFDWTKYLELAEYISNNSKDLPDEEACYRAAVSRAYYAAFRTTCGYLSKADRTVFQGGGAHSEVRDHLKKNGDKLRRKVANQLNGFHFDRIKADYYDDISRENPRKMAFKSITTAKKIVNEIEELAKRA